MGTKTATSYLYFFLVKKTILLLFQAGISIACLAVIIGEKEKLDSGVDIGTVIGFGAGCKYPVKDRGAAANIFEKLIFRKHSDVL